MFRVRDTAAKTPQATGRRSPDGLNDSNLPSVTGLIENGTLDPRFAVVGAGVAANAGGRREGAKPFLDQLFDDVRLTTDAELESRNAPNNAFDGRVPPQSYHEQVRRQWAKPNILQTCVSTDAVPLPTVTGPVNYTTFDTSHVERPEDPPTYGGQGRRGRVFAGMHAAVEMRKTRDALIVMPNGTIRPALERNALMSGNGTAAALSFYNESEELADVHLKFLMSTIDQVKRRTNPSATFAGR